MNKAAVYHGPESIYAYAAAPERLRVRLKVAKGDAACCSVVYKNVYDHGPENENVRMEKVAQDDVSEWYETDLELPGKRFKYYFRIVTAEGETLFYTPDGVTGQLKSPPEFFYCPYLFEEDVPSHPEWAEGAMIYQVFVERFCNGDRANDPQQVRVWGDTPDRSAFFGGDLAGLKSKLDYIASLGTSIIYLNPVFLADTYHKYDIKDYYCIDPSFGSSRELQEMVEDAHKLGMKVILDAVFNHCSDKNPIFEDVVQNGRQSRYASWFTIKNFPIIKAPPNYDAFAGVVSEMPRLNTSNPEVQEYLISSAEYWTRYLDLDGWRLDVADEVSHAFWKLFRRRMKKIRKDVFILGEVWNRATPWLLGDECDSATNYKFKRLMLEFINHTKVSSKELWDGLEKNAMNYKTTTLPLLVNLLGSHDTQRLLNAVGGNPDIARAALGVMLTFSGMPLVYYGDEIGMQGDDDPDNRRCMIWDEREYDTRMLTLVRTLGNARKRMPVLSHGILEPHREVPSRVLAYKRRSGSGDTVLVAANFGTTDETMLLETGCLGAETFKSLLCNAVCRADGSGTARITVAAGDIAVLANEACFRKYEKV